MNNVIPLVTKTETDINDDILVDMAANKARGKEINLYDYLNLLDLSTNVNRIRDWLVKERLITRREWKRAIEIKRTRDDLGGDPKTPAIFLDLYCKKYEISVDYKKGIKQQGNRVVHEGRDVEIELKKISDEIESSYGHDIENLLQQKRLCEDILRCKTSNYTAEDLARSLRIKSKELDLKFSAHDLDDVIQEWIKSERSNRRFDIFSKIMYTPGKATSEVGQNLWHDTVRHTFDTSEMHSDFLIAIIKKLIWQVKRKIQKIPVTNHLMPILLGPQGVGKTTWINKFVGPLSELVASTDFRQITDDRNIDIWENFVLILDEMGYATKADIEVVKNLITATTILRRVMRSNNAIGIRQNAVLIGATNREIDQIIRDETGARRFIGIRFLKRPNFDFINSTDFSLLWQSVDEQGPDPLSPYIKDMQVVQEEIRVMNPCEEWIYSLKNGFGNGQFIPASMFFQDYRNWESCHYERRKLDFDEWNKELRRLIHTRENFPLEMTLDGRNYAYRFLGN